MPHSQVGVMLKRGGERHWEIELPRDIPARLAPRLGLALKHGTVHPSSSWTLILPPGHPELRFLGLLKYQQRRRSAQSPSPLDTQHISDHDQDERHLSHHRAPFKGGHHDDHLEPHQRWWRDRDRPFQRMAYLPPQWTVVMCACANLTSSLPDCRSPRRAPPGMEARCRLPRRLHGRHGEDPQGPGQGI